ncbi:MAG: carboxypeptidase regulatory-like domain-containing protein [Candidatus Doudnabacteria bacterium]|nr:carboxypeptidase regulatory-like domain-containing protein [Candidatus Doudnabacteria bacterium]
MKVDRISAMFRGLAILFLIAVAVFAFQFPRSTNPQAAVQANAAPVLPEPPPGQLWHFQCIDTMKYSRDAAREFLDGPTKSAQFIAAEVAIIKSLGATCVSVGTPYDEEFIPLLKQWTTAIHAAGLQVWFRGNFAGWEGWFNYPLLKNTAEHYNKTYSFIVDHPDLFTEGDIFSPAPEAENGLLGSPWASSSARKALVDFAWKSSDTCQRAVAVIQKKVHCGYFSANGDVARDVYTRDVLQKAGAVTVIDHYISSTVQYGRDLDVYAQKHKLPIVIGEFGAPIPDLNGDLTEQEQAQYVGELLRQFYTHKKQILGLNYWVLRGGSTQLLNNDGSERAVMEVIRDYFLPGQIVGTVVDGIGRPVKNAVVTTGDGVQSIRTNAKGNFALSTPPGALELQVGANGYSSLTERVETTRSQKTAVKLVIHPTKPSLWYKLRAKMGI